MRVQLGGTAGRTILTFLARRFHPGFIDWEAVDPDTTSGMRKYFGDETIASFRGMRLIDFGCGPGADAVAAALAGAVQVVGVDVQAHHIASARKLAEKHGVADRCRFIDVIAEPDEYAALAGGFDVVTSMDAFEHFEDPVHMLHEMHRMLAPRGRVIISFGPPWKHPMGAHLMAWIKLPWIHFLFREETVLEVRSRYLDDGAKRYEDVPGGLNRMTLASYESIVAASPFRSSSFDPVPIRPFRLLAKIPGMREYVTSIVRSTLVVRDGYAATP